MSRTDLPANGEISYNSVVFPVETETLEIRGTPHYDQAGRTVAYVVYMLRLRAIFSNSSGTTDTQLDGIRDSLLRPGGAFQYGSKGFGALQINVTGIRDVLWGPRPTMFSWKPIGSNRAVEIEWGVEVAIPQCSTSARYRFALMEVNYRLGFSIDRSGLTTRTYSGYLTIPETRDSVGSRTLSDSADGYRDSVNPFVPEGFTRVSQDYQLNEAKTRLDFTIVDQENPSTLQPGVISCQASHTISSAENNLSRWHGTIEATYELSQAYPRAAALQLFFALVQDRLDSISTFGLDQGGSRTKALITSLQMREPDIFGRNVASFSVQYNFPCSRTTLMRASGLWTQVTSANENVWRNSVALQIFGNRGGSQMRFNLYGDAIVDLCGDQSQVGDPTLSVSIRPPFPEYNDVIILKPIDPDQSWLKYKNVIYVEAEERTLEHKPLASTLTAGSVTAPVAAPSPPPAPTGSPPNPTTPYAKLDNNQIGPASFYSANAVTGIFQSQGAPSLYLIMEGAAMRAGYLITPPELTSVNGVPVISANREGIEYVKSDVIADYGMPVVGCEWRKRYLVTAVPPGGIGVLPNPLP